MTGATASANALAGGGYSSSYSGESVFTNVAAGGSGQFSAIFFNDGTQSWAPGVVGLLICLPDKVTCNVASPNAAYASGWTSSTVYATVTATVAPGQNGFFIYNFAVPAGTAGGTAATFNGDVGLIATGAELRPEGYYQINTTPASTGALTLSPTSASLPVGGQQQFTATGAPAGSTVAWSVTGGCGAVTTTGLFAATATTSSTQPCTVVATASGLSASASITVFGPATKLACAVSPASIPADNGNSTSTVTVSVEDVNGNVVANDVTDKITFTNNSPTLVTADNSIEPQTITATNGVASKVYDSETSTGTAVISASSGTLTGCTANITLAKPGAAAQLAAGFSPTTIAADGTSTSKLTVNVEDSTGTLIPSNTDSITISETSGTSVCNVGGAGSATKSAVSGVATFTMMSSTTPGTCSWTASDVTTSSVSSASATLTTVIVGTASKLAVTKNSGSPVTADGTQKITVTVALEDANGNIVTTPAAQVTLTSTLGSGCTGSNAAGQSGKTVTNSGNVTTSNGIAKFVYSSTFATSGCTITYSGNNSSGTALSTASATIAFTPGAPTGIACKFSPAYIVNDGSSTSLATVSIVDTNLNATNSGSYSVTFSKSTDNGATTQLTASPQTTTNGVATFTVKSTTKAGTNTDTYRASTTIGSTAVTTNTPANAGGGPDCAITVQPTLP
ncbi:MAG: hypothetical protein KGJ98_07430 [Chloroflexota bacterium]|nr:hypothetical protein [Chloroflexota bacterium]